MTIWKKKTKVEEALVVILPGDENTIVLEASEILYAIKSLWSTVQTIPGLTNYLKNNLLGKLMPAIAMGDIEKALVIVMSDHIVGPTVQEIATLFTGDVK